MILFFPFLFMFLSITPLLATSISIYNDSPFSLYADIISADGTHKGKLSISPQNQTTWHDSLIGAATWSQTPYTVIFTCKNGKQFGVYSGVSPGATITALSSTGTRYCEEDKKEDTDKQSPPSSPTHPGELYIDPQLGPP